MTQHAVPFPATNRFTYQDCMLAAGERFKIADATRREGNQYVVLAEAMRAHEVRTVGDLPRGVVYSIMKFRKESVR